MNKQEQNKYQFSNELEALRESERKNKIVLDNAYDLISVQKLGDLSYEYVNPTTLKVLGYSEEELLGKSAIDFIHPDDIVRVITTIKENLNKEAGSIEFRYRRKDGAYIWLGANASRMSDENENHSLIVISRDITDRKQSEEALQKAHDELEIKVQVRTARLKMINKELQNEIIERKRVEESLRKEYQFNSAILNTSDALIMVSTFEGRIVSFNTACEQTSGYSFKEVMDKYPWDFLVHGEDGATVKERYKNLTAGENKNTGENYWLTKDGQKRLVRWTNTVLLDKEGSVEYIVSSGIDITEQHEASEALKESEAYYRTIFENTGTATIIVDQNLQIAMANSRSEELSGYSQDELIGQNPFELFVVPEYLKIVQESYRLRKLDPDKAPPYYQIKCIDKQGRVRDCIIYVSLVPHNQNLVISLMDITEQQLAESKIKASEERFRALFENAPVGIGINRKGRTLLANQAYVDMFGYDSSSELYGALVTNQVAPSCRREISNKVKKREKGEELPYSHETIGLRKDGSKFPLFVQVSNILLPDGPANVAFFTDITARKQVEAALQRQVDFQALLLEISKKFTNIVADDIDDMINTTLRMISESDNDVRSSVFLYSDDQCTVSKTNEWCAKGISAVIDCVQGLPVSVLPWWNKKLQSSEYIYIPRVSDLPPEAQAEKELLQAHSIQSLMVVPMFLEDKIIGFMGFDSVKSEKNWSKENVIILESVAQIIVRALQRKKSAIALRASENYYRTIFENTGAATMIIEADMTISLANREWERVFGYKKEELEGAQWTDIISGDIVDVMKEYHRLRRINPTSAPLQYKARIKDHQGKMRDGLFYTDIISGTTKSVATFIDLTDFNRINRALKATSAGNMAMLQASDEQDLLQKVCQKIVEVGGYRMVWVGYVENYERQTVRPVAYAGHEEGYLKTIDISLADPQRGSGPVGMSIRTDQPYISRNVMTDPSLIPIREEALSRGYKSMITIPLNANGGGAFGVISIYSEELDIFDSEEKKLLTEMAADLAYGIMSLRTRIERNQTALELEISLEKMHRILNQTVGSLSTVLEIRDPYTAGHQKKVARLATAIAQEMGFDKDIIDGIYVAGNLHDIGKINVPFEILSKPGKITELEIGIIKTHSQVGYDILKEIEFSWPVADMVLQHHERLDGSGYAQGLRKEEIVIGARILAVADVVDAMASHRPYRPALGVDPALEEITKNKGILYDPEVVDACLKLFVEKGFKL
ncbi:MAG: PAS domain S-box protein [Syntrophomonas sp.]|nr:PAS domain S-box protein [Syntrophomonas sp.]